LEAVEKSPKFKEEGKPPGGHRPGHRPEGSVKNLVKGRAGKEGYLRGGRIGGEQHALTRERRGETSGFNMSHKGTNAKKTKRLTRKMAGKGPDRQKKRERAAKLGKKRVLRTGPFSPIPKPTTEGWNDKGSHVGGGARNLRTQGLLREKNDAEQYPKSKKMTTCAATQTGQEESARM